MLDVRTSVSSEPYVGLLSGHRRDSEPFTGRLAFKHPGKSGYPEQGTLETPPVLSSASTDRKKTNAVVCYTRVTPLDSHMACGETGGCVFVSRKGMMFTGEGCARRSLVASLDVVNAHLSEATPYVGDNPLDDWRSVRAIRAWSLDGVLLSHRNEANASCVLNVAVHGPSPAANVFDTERPLAGDVCYLALIAQKLDGEPRSYRFKYVPCTSRPFADPDFYDARRNASVAVMSPDKRRMVVGAWRVGSVLDAAAVDEFDQKTMTVAVNVQWVGWRALCLMHGKAVGDVRGMPVASGMAIPADARSTQLFNWPSYEWSPIDPLNPAAREAIWTATPKVPQMSKIEQMKNRAANLDEQGRANEKFVDAVSLEELSALHAAKNSAEPVNIGDKDGSGEEGEGEGEEEGEEGDEGEEGEEEGEEVGEGE